MQSHIISLAVSVGLDSLEQAELLWENSLQLLLENLMAAEAYEEVGPKVVLGRIVARSHKVHDTDQQRTDFDVVQSQQLNDGVRRLAAVLLDLLAPA